MDLSSEAVWCMVFDPPISLDWSENKQLAHFLRKGRIALVNQVYSEIVGVEQHKLIGLSMAEFISLDNIQALEMLVRADYRLNDAETTEVYPGGNRVTVLNNVFPIIEGREVLRIWGTSRDVTQHAEAEQRFQSLSSREREVLALLTRGHTNKEVGEDLSITERTVKAHRASVMKKLQLTSFADLVRVATENGWAQGQVLHRTLDNIAGAA